jgi:transcription elongation factor Elf1
LKTNTKPGFHHTCKNENFQPLAKRSQHKNSAQNLPNCIQTQVRKLQEMLEEHFFNCPYCWQEISMLLDLSSGGQQYVEDCEVCCNPITISFQTDDGNITEFSAEPLQQ